MNKVTFFLLLLVFPFVGYAGDWNGKWIVNFDNQNITNSWHAFRKQVNVDRVPKQAIARIAVDSKYWMWIWKARRL